MCILYLYAYMSDFSLIERVANDIISKMKKETKHGHFLRYKDKNMENDDKNNLEYISIEYFFKDKENLKNVDWKWGLQKDEIDFVIEYFEYFTTKKEYV